MDYSNILKSTENLLKSKTTWNAIEPEFVTRMKVQNRFKSGVEIAKYCSKIMRQDMAEYEKDPSKYTQSLGCWHGFVAQQVFFSIFQKFVPLPPHSVLNSDFLGRFKAQILTIVWFSQKLEISIDVA